MFNNSFKLPDKVNTFMFPAAVDADGDAFVLDENENLWKIDSINPSNEKPPYGNLGIINGNPVEPTIQTIREDLDAIVRQERERLIQEQEDFLKANMNTNLPSDKEEVLLIKNQIDGSVEYELETRKKEGYVRPTSQMNREVILE